MTYTIIDANILDIPFLVNRSTNGANNHATTKPIKSGARTFRTPPKNLNAPSSFRRIVPASIMPIIKIIKSNFKIFLLK